MGFPGGSDNTPGSPLQFLYVPFELQSPKVDFPLQYSIQCQIYILILGYYPVIIPKQYAIIQ